MANTGEIVRRMRKERGLTQAELSKRSGLSQSGISDIEKSVNNPSSETVLLLSSALNCSPTELLGHEERAATNEGDGLKQEAMFLFESLNDVQQDQALSYLRFLSKSGDRK